MATKVMAGGMVGGIVAASVLLGVAWAGDEPVNHTPSHDAEAMGDIHRVEQPLWLKGAVTVGGVGLIGLELWWFLGQPARSRPSSPNSPPPD